MKKAPSCHRKSQGPRRLRSLLSSHIEPHVLSCTINLGTLNLWVMAEQIVLIFDSGKSLPEELADAVLCS